MSWHARRACSKEIWLLLGFGAPLLHPIHPSCQPSVPTVLPVWSCACDVRATHRRAAPLLVLTIFDSTNILSLRGRVPSAPLDGLYVVLPFSCDTKSSEPRATSRAGFGSSRGLAQGAQPSPPGAQWTQLVCGAALWGKAGWL